MTEQEWLAATDPTAMLGFVRGRASDRKLRLFAVACCRLFCNESFPPPTRAAIETNELFADGLADERELGRARASAHSAGWGERFETVYTPLAPDARIKSARTVERPGVSEEYLRRVYFVAFMLNVPARLKADPIPMLGTDPILTHSGPALLRDIFGNPHRPVTLNPAWLTPTVVALARQMYASRDFSPMPILADALQDAGCDDEGVLSHCRWPGPHVRGCWAVDLLLGKE